MRFTIYALLIAVVSAQNNDILDTFVNLFTAGQTENSAELVNSLRDCEAPGASHLRDIFTSAVNTTRVCTSLNVNREQALTCIQDASHLTALSLSPYDFLSLTALTTTEITTLQTCAGGVEDGVDTIIKPLEVIVQRFLQLQCDPTQTQKDTIMEIFGGDGQPQQIARANLAAVCTSLFYTGDMFKDALSATTSFVKQMLVLLPNRRR
jgi:hypothetical protein